MKRFLIVTTCKKALIYVNISYDSWIIKSLPPCGHFIECSIVHIFDNHTIIIDLHDNTDMPICRRKSWTMIDNNSTWFWNISRSNSLFTCILKPIFCISMPSHIFIFCHETGTITPDKSTTSFINFKIKRISTITNSLLINWSLFFDDSRFFDRRSRISRFFDRWYNDNFFIWIFCCIWKNKSFSDRERSLLIHIICYENSV